MSNEDRWRRRSQDQYDKFTNAPYRTGFGWAIKVVIVVILLAIIFGVGRFACGWGKEAARIVGPENTRQQFTVLYDLDEGMKALAVKVCLIKNSPTPQGNTLVEDPAFAYKSQYLNAAREYNRRYANFFEGKVVGPPDLPREAPPLTEAMAEAGC